MDWYAKTRARERIAGLAGQGLDLVAFWNASSDALSSAVPHDLTPCWFTLDPASLLVTSHYDHGVIPELPQEWLAHEYFVDDFQKMADVARSERGISTLHEATGGDPGRSPGWNLYMRPYGAEQELLLALRTATGEVWGMLGLYREPGQRLFDDEERDFLRQLSPYLAEGARRGLLVGEASDPDGPDAPGLVVLNGDWSVESMTPGVERWLSELPDGDWARGDLPSAVYAVAGRAMRTAANGESSGEIAVARVLSRTGRWIVLHGAALQSGGSRRAAVIVEPAHPARIFPLLMAAYRLTDREQDVTRLVLQGSSTAEIALSLSISTHTVQQHLKSVFEKTGVRSRRDLVGKVFFSHYEPRLRDNEQRVAAGRPVRGGPLPTTRS